MPIPINIPKVMVAFTVPDTRASFKTKKVLSGACAPLGTTFRVRYGCGEPGFKAKGCGMLGFGLKA